MMHDVTGVVAASVSSMCQSPSLSCSRMRRTQPVTTTKLSSHPPRGPPASVLVRRGGAPAAQGRPIRVVPMRGAGGLVAPAPPVRAPSAAQLTYRGGPLLTAVEVVTAFWGVAWNEATAQATVQALNSFFQFVVASPYLDQLAEYGTPQVKIGRGRYAGTAC